MTFGLVLEHNFVKNFICNNSNLGKFLIINLVTIIILVTIAVVSVYMVKPVISIIHAAKSQDPPSKLTTKLTCLLIIWTLCMSKTVLLAHIFQLQADIQLK